MMTTISPRKAALGLSLVELMVAITISSVLLLGVSSVYLSSRRSNAVQDEFSRMQENGRFAVHTLTKEVRQAGYLGCVNLDRMDPPPVNNVAGGGGAADTAFNFTSATAVVGHTACSGGTGAGCTPSTPVGTLPVISGTEAITIRRASSCSSVLTGNMGVPNANIQMTGGNPCNFQANEVMFITDCKDGDIFRATNVANGARTVVAHANNGNVTNFLSKAYGIDARVMKWERLTYYIAPCSSGVAGCRSLFVNVDQGNANVSTELVEHVDDMQIEYRVDSTPSLTDAPSVDSFLTGAQVQAGGLWGSVLAVRIHLLTTTRDNVARQNNSKDETPYTFMGFKLKSTDRRYRREFTTTINIRNRTL